MINPGEHVSIFGMTGCGKSTLTRSLATIYPRRIIFDRMGEWSNAGLPVCSNFAEFSHLYRQFYQAQEFTILYRPKPGLSQDFLVSDVNQVLALVYQVESQTGRGIALIFEEVWLYAPIHSTPPWLQEISLTGRHYNIAIVANAQRPAHVSKTLVTQSRHVFVGQFFEANDRKYLRDTLGDLPELQRPPPPGEFIWFRPAQPLQTQKVKVF